MEFCFSLRFLSKLLIHSFSWICRKQGNLRVSIKTRNFKKNDGTRARCKTGTSGHLIYSISYLPKARHVEVVLLTNSAHIISKVIPTINHPGTVELLHVYPVFTKFPLEGSTSIRTSQISRSHSHLAVKFAGNYRSCISRFLVHW